MMRAIASVTAVALIILVQCGHAKVVENTLDSDPPYAHKNGSVANWVFLAKFAFDVSGDDFGPPQLLVERLNIPEAAKKTTLMLVYDDEFASWDHIYDSDSLSCEDRIAQSKLIGGLHGMAYVGNFDGSVSTAIHVDEHTRPHYWYVVLANCGADAEGRPIGLTSIDYKLHFENPGGHYSVEFGYDIQGVIWVYVVFLILFSGILVAALVSLYRMYADFHPIGDLVPFRPLVQLYVLSVSMELIADIIYIMHYAVYANDGQGMQGLKIGAEVLHGMSECALIVLIIFIAKGWNVNRYGVGAKVGMCVVLTSLYTLYVAMIVVGNLHAETPTSIYIYDTSPGIVLNCLRVFFAFALMGVFANGAIKAFNSANVRAQQAQKSLMFFIFLVCLWLIITPVVSLVVSFIAAYDREKVAVCFECIAHVYGCGMLLWILWPGRIHDYFSVNDTSLTQSISEYDGGSGDSTAL